MDRKPRLLYAFGIVAALVFSLPAGAFGSSPGQAFSAAPKTKAAKPKSASKTKAGSRIAPPVLWRDRGQIESLNLLYGPGGEEHKPGGTFTFVKEDKKGSSPKFEVIDEQGVHWKAKLGEETKSETAATRLVWAAGYFADEDYYLPEIHVAKMPKLDRGQEFVSAGGVVHGVRLERNLKGQKKAGNWSWFKNPFVGTKELDGLKVMMALINNWDLKEINNAIYRQNGEGNRYAISDLGASFGETGNVITRSKSNLKDFSDAKFVQKVTDKHVDFYLSSRPLPVAVFDVPNYVSRTHMQDIVKEIPIAHVRWLGKVLEPLSDDQIRDCFRAAGYSPQEVEGYAAVVKERIKALSSL